MVIDFHAITRVEYYANSFQFRDNANFEQIEHKLSCYEHNETKRTRDSRRRGMFCFGYNAAWPFASQKKINDN